MSIVLFKLVGNEFVIAEKVSETPNDITIKDSLKVATVYSQGKMGVQFEPFNPFATGPGEEIVINRMLILFFTESKELMAEYIKITSGIAIAKSMPSASDVKLR